MKLSDKGLAEQIGQEKMIRYTPGIGFYIWTGTRWRRDYEDGLMAAGLIGDWLHDNGHLANLRPIRQLRDVMRDRECLRVPAELWDTNPELFGWSDGIYDLRTGQNLGFDHRWMVTMHSPYRPERPDLTVDGSVCAPRYWRHLQELCDCDQDLVKLLCSRAGYWLTGYTSLQDLVVLEGEGGRGKSVWTNIIAEVMGPDYAGAAPRGLITKSEHSYANDDYAIADIRGRRLLVQSETDRNTQLNEELIKSLTGGDELRGRAAYAREHASYRPQAKCLLLTNYPLRLRSLGKDMERRLTVLRLTYKGDPPPTELDLFRRIVSEEGNQVAAILMHWAQRWLTGSAEHREWLPDRVLQARRDTMAESDTVRQWMDDRLLRTRMSSSGEQRSIPAAAAVADYRRWAEDNGYRPMSAGSLKRELERLGVHQVRRETGHVYVNVCFQESEV